MEAGVGAVVREEEGGQDPVDEREEGAMVMGRWVREEGSPAESRGLEFRRREGRWGTPEPVTCPPSPPSASHFPVPEGFLGRGGAVSPPSPPVEGTRGRALSPVEGERGRGGASKPPRAGTAPAGTWWPEYPAGVTWFK
jgi:hypothetical protein